MPLFFKLQLHAVDEFKFIFWFQKEAVVSVLRQITLPQLHIIPPPPPPLNECVMPLEQMLWQGVTAEDMQNLS